MPALFGEVKPKQGEDIRTMFDCKVISGAKAMLLAGVLASSILVTRVGAQSPAPAAPHPAGSAPVHRPDRFAGRAGTYYRLIWGVDSLSVKYAESGEIIRFAYRVLDADKAKILNDKKLEPSLIDPQAGLKLVVPALEQVGLLRQSGTPEVGKVYWMAFSNKGRKVKRGDRVIVEIGHFRADGLVVD
jgi:hypothetical protein